MTGREQIVREQLHKLQCQHCKALQKSSGCIIECWYNPLATDGDFGFCMANDDAVNAFLDSTDPKGNKFLGIIAEDQSLPKIEIPNHSRSTGCPHCGEEVGYEDAAEAEQYVAQELILKDNWVKIEG